MNAPDEPDTDELADLPDGIRRLLERIGGRRPDMIEITETAAADPPDA